MFDNNGNTKYIQKKTKPTKARTTQKKKYNALLACKINTSYCILHYVCFKTLDFSSKYDEFTLCKPAILHQHETHHSKTKQSKTKQTARKK